MFVISCLLYYLVDSHYCVSYLVPTKYYADAADRAIQYATDAATQEDEDSLEVEAEEAPAEQEVEAEAPAVAETVTRRLVDSLGRMTNEDLDLFCKFVNHEQLYSEDESEEDDDGKAVFEVLCIVVIVFCY